MTVVDLLARRQERRRRALQEVEVELMAATSALEDCARVLQRIGGWPAAVSQLRSASILIEGTTQTIMRETR